MASETPASTHPAPGGDPATHRAPPGALAVFLNIFFEPRPAFQALNLTPRWVFPLLVAAAMATLTQAVLMYRVDRETLFKLSAPGLAKKMNDPQVANAVRQQIENPPAPWITYVTTPVVVAALVLAVAGIFVGIFALFDFGGTFKKVFSVTAHAMAAHGLAYNGLAAIIVWLKTDHAGMDLYNIVMANPAFLLDPSAGSPFLRSLAASLDLLSAWLLYLLIVGYAAVQPQASRRGTAAVVLSLWLLYVLGKASFAAAMASLIG